MGKFTSYRYDLGTYTKRFTAGTLSLIIGLSGLVAATPLFLSQTADAAGSIVYNSIPATYPGSFPSQGYQATQTSELGDYIQLSGSDRRASSVDVSLTSWACENDFTLSGSTWTANRSHADACTTTPGSHYNHDITLNLYNVNDPSGTPTAGSLITTVTKNVEVPFRPSYDPTNTHNCKAPADDLPFGGTWYDPATDSCVHGKAFNVTFELSTTNSTLPNDVIVAVAYNTSHYGSAPLTQVGPYDSLNLSLTTSAPSTGTNAESDAVFWRKAAGALNRDTGWGGYTPVMKLVTVPIPTVQPCTTTTTLETTDLSTWDRSETRSHGHNVLTSNGLHVYTDDASSEAKAAGYYPTGFALSDLGDQTIAQSIDYDATTGITPGLQLVTDFDNDGTADGILVGESIYGNNWWLTNSAAQFVKDGAPHTGGGNGSNWYGTPNDWLTKFPDARVQAIGYSLGSGVHGDGILKRISLGCTDYTFRAMPPAAPTNLHFAQGTKTLACDGTGGTNSNSSGTLFWTAPSGGIKQYVVTPNYPDNSGEHPFYPGGSTTAAWVTGNFAHHGEGVYSYTIKAQGLSGLWGAAATCNIIYDVHSPEAAFTQAPVDNTYLSGTFHVEGTASDNVSLKSANFDVRDSNGWKTGCVAGSLHADYSADHKSATLKCDIDTSSLQDGSTYYVRIHASDYAGYGSKDIAPLSIRHFTVDRTAPAKPTGLTIYKGHNSAAANELQCNGYTNDTKIRIAWTPNAESDLAGYWFGTKNNTHHKWVPAGINYYDGNMTPGNNPYSYTVIAVDKAGHESAISDSCGATLDQTAPTVTVTPLAADGILHGSVNFQITVSDDNLDTNALKHLYVYLYNIHDGTQKFGQKVDLSSGSGTFTVDTTGLDDGSYSLDVGNFKDLAGNNAGNNDPHDQYFTGYTIDNTGPEVSDVVLNGQNVNASDIRSANCEPTKNFYTISGTVDLNATLADSLSGVDKASYKIRKVTAGGCTQTSVYQSSVAKMQDEGSNAWTTVAGTMLDTAADPNLVDGDYTIMLTVADKTGNPTTKYVDITVDNNAPVVSINSYGTAGNVIQPDVTVTDPAPGTALSYLWTPNDPNVTVSDTHAKNPTFTVLSDGTYTFTLTATDAAGNTGSDTFTFTYTTPAPTLAPPATPAAPFTNVGTGTGTPLTDNGTGTNAPQVLGATTGDDNDVLGVEGQSGTASSSTDKKADTKNAKATTCAKFLGVCWYYWVPVVLIVGYIVYRFFRAADENQTSTGK